MKIAVIKNAFGYQQWYLYAVDDTTILPSDDDYVERFDSAEEAIEYAQNMGLETTEAELINNS